MTAHASGKLPPGRGPWIRVSVLWRLIEPLVEEIGPAAVADLASVPQRTIYRWRHGEYYWASFSIVDRVIVDVLDNPSLWLLDPDLAAAYEEASC